jgi:glycosyltransferase involved in cell wall biosynthesis
VVTVHDLIPKTHPELITKKARLYSHFMIPYAIRSANRILTVSQYSRNILLNYYPDVAEKTIVTYNGSDLDFRSARGPGTLKSVVSAYGIDGDFILFVGALMEHKNVFRLIEAYNALEPSLQSRYALVIVGRLVPGHERFVQSVRNAIRSNARIILVHYVEEVDLPCVYAAATAFVFPSLQEGFGIPLVEAMSASLPVVAGNATAVPEICGDAALYIDPNSVQSLRDGTARILSDPRLRSELAGKAKARSIQFTWETTAYRTLQIYEELRGKVPSNERD